MGHALLNKKKGREREREGEREREREREGEREREKYRPMSGHSPTFDAIERLARP
jgi:hypothetical protein